MTQEENVIHSSAPAPSLKENKKKEAEEREREREGLREELTALRQTQRMRAALDPCGSPRCAERTHTRQLPATRGESEVLLQVWRVRSGGQPRQVGAFLFLLLLLLSSCSSCLCFGIRRSKGKAKPRKDFLSVFAVDDPRGSSMLKPGEAGPANSTTTRRRVHTWSCRRDVLFFFFFTLLP